LRVLLHVYDVDDTDGDGGSSMPLKEAKVDIWHFNAHGLYSGVQDDGTGGNNFLRGYQMTDSNGTAQFNTVFPGWYEGRMLTITDIMKP
jgi:protocatechuate 3,4-dioxygenase beta subunit